MKKRVKLSMKLSAVLLTGTFFIIGSAELPPEEEMSGSISIGQALLGPLSEAPFKIYDQRSNEVMYSGITTKGDGSDVSSAGLIKVTQELLDSLKGRLYRVEVSGGTDIDANDDGVWDATPTPNAGKLNSIMSEDQIKKGDFKVNILTEIVYQNVKDEIKGDESDDTIEQFLKIEAEKLLKEGNAGDINGDGKIDNQDLIDWDPSKSDDKEALKKDYETEIKPIVEATHKGEDPKTKAKKLYQKENEDTNGDGIIDTFYTYDENGNLLEEWYDKNQDGIKNEPPYIDTFTYYPDNKLKTKTCACGTYSYTYNTNGKISVEIFDFHNRGELITNTYTYDERGNVIKKIVKNPSKTYHGREGVYTYTYDENNNEISCSFNGYRGEGINILYTITSTYDEKGNKLTESYDEDSNGVIDWSRTYTYNKEGLILTESVDGDGDGVVDMVYTYTYHDNGRRASEKIDFGNDGSIDNIYTYNENGYILSELRDYNNDGVNDLITYTYHDNGRRASEKIDFGNDGSIDEESTFNENGNRLTWLMDWNNDGVNDLITYTYHANGHRASEKIDFGNDGSIDEKSTFNENGNRLTTLMDRNNDGVNDLITYTYHANGRIASEKIDFGNDGTIDEESTFDENGNQLTRLGDWNNDGVKDLITYTCHANGRIASEKIDFGNDGSIDEKSTFDENGNQLTRLGDWNNDGVKDLVTYTYHANGRIASEKIDFGNDGTIDEESTFDENGNRLTRLIDRNNDGVNDLITYTYHANGHRASEKIDFGNDGTIDEESTFDENGNRLTTLIDYNSDGVKDLITYTYHDNGYIASGKIDFGNDGSIDEESTFNENGNQLTRLGDSNNDGVKDLITYTYHDNGNMASEKIDYGNDGSIDETYNYDSNGNPI